MVTTNELRREKIILLVLLLISFLFVLGCSVKGNEPEMQPVKYEFSVGKYTVSSSRYDYMFYTAVNQEKGKGLIFDTNGNPIKGSAFNTPVNYADGSFWVADGYYRMKDNKEYAPGTYSLQLNCWDSNIEKYLNWEGIPEWEKIPEIEFDGKQTVFVNKIHPVVLTEASKDLSVRYRLKIYVGGLQSTRLFGQSVSTTYTSYISYSLPKKMSQNTLSLVPVLVAELYNANGIQMIVFCPGSEIKY